ncbi:MAG TPA: periplasmic heavy metal sensor [Deltaproteobacteria bacterium]|jgi:Spy/CpxP family protein refolding chaperone|nr:periplasmic heavy metal sensor [Deltaproteobacteria bacterium]HOI07414.1 periplasmic heavy metal sensor [Deltaproteobacteria bacterium]
MKRMKAGILAIGMMLFLCPVVALAQGDAPSSRWWRVPDFADKLDLSTQEKGQLEKLFMEKRKVMFQMKSEVEKQRFELDNLLEMPRLDERAALREFKKLEAKRHQLAEERFRYLLEVRRILGHERYLKLMTLAKEQRGKKGRAPADDLSPR